MSFIFDPDTLQRLEKVNKAQVQKQRGIFLDVKPAKGNEPPPAYRNNFLNEINTAIDSVDESKIQKVSFGSIFL